MKISQIFLLPFAIIYSIIIRCWYWYSTKLKRPVHYSLPIVSVGNLQVGGTGKTPMVDYLINLFQNERDILVLSRGYMRKSKGLKIVSLDSIIENVGDEPLFIKKKFPNTHVVVAEDRVSAIPYVLQDIPSVDMIILDDGFQQLGMEIDVQILLTPYHRPYTEDKILPIGRLRENIEQSKRADIIIITKCPSSIFRDKKDVFKKLGIDVLPNQKGFLSSIEYGIPYSMMDQMDRKELDKNDSVLLVTGIADAKPLFDYVKDKVGELKHLEFSDHYMYTDKDLVVIEQAYLSLVKKSKIILVTEKDSARLIQFHNYFHKKHIYCFVQPIKIKLDDEVGLLKYIKNKLVK